MFSIGVLCAAKAVCDCTGVDVLFWEGGDSTFLATGGGGENAADFGTLLLRTIGGVDVTFVITTDCGLASVFIRGGGIAAPFLRSFEGVDMPFVCGMDAEFLEAGRNVWVIFKDVGVIFCDASGGVDATLLERDGGVGATCLGTGGDGVGLLVVTSDGAVGATCLATGGDGVGLLVVTSDGGVGATCLGTDGDGVGLLVVDREGVYTTGAMLLGIEAGVDVIFVTTGALFAGTDFCMGNIVSATFL
jgi:hypothetical protein